PVRFFEEVNQLRAAGVPVSGDSLVVSDHAHVIFPYHMEEERLSESGGGGDLPIGTTGRGIGPCYQDKVGRVCGIRVGELLHPESLREKLRGIVARKNRLLTALGADANPPAKNFDSALLADDYTRYGERLRPFVTDTT